MKRIILTGASSGIGLACLDLLKDNYRVHILSRKEEQLAKLCEDHDHLSYSVCNVQDYEECTKAVNQAVKEMGGLDVLINNAGVGYFDPIEKAKINEWKAMIDTNITGALNMIHSCLPELLNARGHVINITSVAAHQVFPNNTVYCATKHALLAISKGLRLELGGKIKVTSISPGAVDTAFIDQTTNEELLSQYKDYFKGSLNANTVAQQIKYAIEMSDESVISEIIIRPNRMPG